MQANHTPDSEPPQAVPPSNRTRVRRAAERAHYDAPTVHAIVDDAWLCHVAFACPDVLCLPTTCWRVDDMLYIHGSNGSRMMKHLASGAPACVTITHLDGLVMARSAFSHSMNYRSVVVHGAFEVVADEDKPAVLHALMEHIAPGRGHDSREPDANELKATTVLGIPLHESAAKIRNWGPRDNEEDLNLPHWAGVLPLMTQRLPAVTHPDSRSPVPGYIADWLTQAQPPGMI
ncbi:MAG: pyridoxamine 5'-phosphate oxidase family protein [Aquabacterium sp.]|uniref:pyridoxamine 5'-phosphate oxidase family protein n=1 Tax=Aquabacterium sp. TaxID=1872578 RepID=UPI0025C7378C|nr:pyridoxamine 5'-phosphate oxidase family protein [Aquabacterium sp.]MBI5925917.1 pyridoxamine 5'-phosphate oxidase family protein [Aquabacterium sp.]